MSIFLVLVFTVPLLIFGLIAFFVFRGMNAAAVKGQAEMAELDARIAAATPAQAKVLGSRSLSTFEDGARAIVELSLEVESPARGRYTAKTRWALDLASLSLVAPGQLVAVKIDAARPDTVYPNVGFATFWPHWR